MNGISRDPDGAARIVPGLTYMRFDLIYGSVLQNEQNCPRTGTFLLLSCRSQIMKDSTFYNLLRKIVQFSCDTFSIGEVADRLKYGR